MSLEIYKETILEHYRNPTNIGIVKNPDVISKDYNPSCGDAVEIQVKFNKNKIKEIKFQGQGCAISQSSTDILIDLMTNKTTEDVKKISSEEFIKKLNIELSPLRLKCALLGLKTLKTAVYSHLGKQF